MEPVTIIGGILYVAKFVKVGSIITKAVMYKSCAVL